MDDEYSFMLFIFVFMIPNAVQMYFFIRNCINMYKNE